jgi:hypothetical protein
VEDGLGFDVALKEEQELTRLVALALGRKREHASCVLSLERMRRWGKMAAGFFPPCLVLHIFFSPFILLQHFCKKNEREGFWKDWQSRFKTNSKFANILVLLVSIKIGRSRKVLLNHTRKTKNRFYSQ